MLSAVISSISLVLCFLRGVQSSPYVIADDRVRSLDITPTLGRGYSIMTNSYQSICLTAEEVTIPSYNYDYSFYDFSNSKNTEVDMASEFSYSFGYSWYKGKVAQESRSSSTTTSKLRYVVSSMRIERYYTSIREDRSYIIEDAQTLLTNGDYVGFFKACGPTYIRGIRRAQEVVAFFIFRSNSSERSSSHARSVQVSGWWGNYGSSRDRSSSNKSESQSTRIIIQGYGLGLTQDGGETLVAQSLQDYNRVIKFAFKSMTTMDDADSVNVGMVYGMEVVPWVENTVFQVAVGLLDEDVEIPIAKSLIPRAFKILDPTDTTFDNSSDATRSLFRCKEPSFEIDMYGYCCEAESLYDYVTNTYIEENPHERVCRPLRQLEPVFVKDNLVANGEFVARLDRSVRYKLNQLATLERCISAAKSIPARYDWNLLVGQDTVKIDGGEEIDFSVFELKMALDPFNDHSMFEHMAAELDEYLDRFIQPCYAAIFGSNVGFTPDIDVTNFMAYPWHTHPECTKLSCLGASMRWDRANPRGGCVPSMISGKDSPSFNSGESECKKEIVNGVLRCVHESVELTNHHEKTVQCWAAVVPRGRIDFFMQEFCMPKIRQETLSNEAIAALKKSHMTKCSGLTEKSINVALGKPATQSNILRHRWGDGLPGNAVDGNTDGVYHRRSVMHTGYDPRRSGTIDPWWYVDLEDDFHIIKIVVHPRTDYIGSRNNNFRVSIIKDNREVWNYTYGGVPSSAVTIPVNGNVIGDKVKIELTGGSYQVLQLSEVQVFNRYFS